MIATPIRTIFHLRPTVGPFLAPREGSLASETNFAGQIRLLPLACHGAMRN